MKEESRVLQSAIEWIRTIAIAILIAVLFKLFIGDTTRVKGNSMNDTLHNDDVLFVDKISMNISGLKRGDIVILDAPDEENTKYIKRVVGMPGDVVSIEDGKVYVNGEYYEENYTNTDTTNPITDESYWQLKDGEYFVMGDNRLVGQSNDSRAFGPITEESIVGHAVFRIYPFNSFEKIEEE